MTSVERVKLICKERKIPISRLEKCLGFANGYIGQLKKGTMPAERLSMVADYLGVSQEYLMSGKEEKPADEIGELSKEELDYIKWFREEATEKEKALVRMIVEGDK